MTPSNKFRPRILPSHLSKSPETEEMTPHDAVNLTALQYRRRPSPQRQRDPTRLTHTAVPPAKLNPLHPPDKWRGQA